MIHRREPGFQEVLEQPEDIDMWAMDTKRRCWTANSKSKRP